VEDCVHRFLVAVDDVENAGWQTRLDEKLGQPQRHARVALRGLQDEGIAAGERRADLPQRDHRREVERRDTGDDAERLAHGKDVDPWAGTIGELALQQMRSADRSFDDFEAALYVPARIGDRLAVFASQYVREFVI